MPKMAESDQKMFNLLIRAQADFIDLANVAILNGDSQRAEWYMREIERCSKERDEIIAKYVEPVPEIITEVINGTRVTGTREYIERMRKALSERTVNVNVVCLVRNIR